MEHSLTDGEEQHGSLKFLEKIYLAVGLAVMVGVERVGTVEIPLGQK